MLSQTLCQHVSNICSLLYSITDDLSVACSESSYYCKLMLLLEAHSEKESINSSICQILATPLRCPHHFHIFISSANSPNPFSLLSTRRRTGCSCSSGPAVCRGRSPPCLGDEKPSCPVSTSNQSWAWDRSFIYLTLSFLIPDITV